MHALSALQLLSLLDEHRLQIETQVAIEVLFQAIVEEGKRNKTKLAKFDLSHDLNKVLHTCPQLCLLLVQDLRLEAFYEDDVDEALHESLLNLAYRSEL